MKSIFAFTLLLGAAFARPSREEVRDDVQTAHFTFHGGPASYDLAVKADGVEVQTSTLSISLAITSKQLANKQQTTTSPSASSTPTTTTPSRSAPSRPTASRPSS